MRQRIEYRWAMFAVEVQDAQGRPIAIADNAVTFHVTGSGKVIGVGNGDPTSHEPDKGTSRKAFSGLCMALVQSSKSAGSITVEASSPGLTPATVTIAAKAARLRPQAPAWEREVPIGSGVTGLWRTTPEAAAAGRGGGGFGGGGTQLFTLRQNGGALTCTVEGGGRGGDAAAPIEEGEVEGNAISCKAANVTYTGTVKGNEIELQRTGGPGRGGGRNAPAQPTGSRPAIGPPPDGSDPSNAAFINGGRGGRGTPAAPPPLVIVRAKR